MKVIDPQSATLTNIEVLAYLTANPPRRPPNPPPNSRHWVPNPDLRDHNTVVKEIHNYVHRISPHLLNYPRYVHEQTLQQLQQQQQQQQDQQQQQQQQALQVPPAPPPTEPTPMDIAIRELITKLQPYGLTKGEVLMIINLGIGLDKPSQTTTTTQPQNQESNNAEPMENGETVTAETAEPEAEGGAGEGEEAVAEEEDDDYGARALLDTVIEEREERLSNEDITAILGIIRETLGKRNG